MIKQFKRFAQAAQLKTAVKISGGQSSVVAQARKPQTKSVPLHIPDANLKVSQESYKDHSQLFDPKHSVDRQLAEKFTKHPALQTTERRQYLLQLMDSLNDNAQYSLADKCRMLTLACDFFISASGDRAVKFDTTVHALQGTQQALAKRI